MEEKNINITQQGTCILVGAGELLVDEIVFNEEDYIIAVDGGLEYCRKFGIAPHLIVGDFDSVSDTIRKELESTHSRSVITLPKEKDDTDMVYAAKIGLEKGYRTFLLYAATGKRLEHTIANIQTLLYLKEHGANGSLIEKGNEIFILQNEEISFDENETGLLSLFSMGEKATGVNIMGMKYPLTEAVITQNFPIGISNEFLGEAAKVSVQNGILLCIKRRNDQC